MTKVDGMTEILTSSFDDITNIILDELERVGTSPEMINKAKERLRDRKFRNRIIEITKIDNDKVQKATDIKNQIDTLSNDIVSLRYRVNEASKILNKKFFEDNSETSRISNNLRERSVKDQDSLHLFIDDIHKYIVQSGDWSSLRGNNNIEPILKMIDLYRNSFNHIYDMRGGGDGTNKAYKKLGKITAD